MRLPVVSSFFFLPLRHHYATIPPAVQAHKTEPACLARRDRQMDPAARDLFVLSGLCVHDLARERQRETPIAGAQRMERNEASVHIHLGIRRKTLLETHPAL